MTPKVGHSDPIPTKSHDICTYLVVFMPYVESKLLCKIKVIELQKALKQEFWLSKKVGHDSM